MPIAPERDDTASLARALAVAKGLRCHLDVVFVRPDPKQTFFYTGVAPQDGALLVADMQESMEKHGKRAAEHSRRTFSKLSREAGIGKARKPAQADTATGAWHQERGEAFYLVPALARRADISLFTPETAKFSLLSENVFDAALLRSGRPVLYLPDASPGPDLSRALIAWDGSDACARAISAWLASGIALEHASVIHVADFSEEQPETKSVQEHLAWHGVESDITIVERRSEPVGKVLADHARAEFCGVIIMGGYGHLRKWEAVFGGVTRYMIRHAPLPVLMMH